MQYWYLNNEFTQFKCLKIMSTKVQCISVPTVYEKIKPEQILMINVKTQTQ